MSNNRTISLIQTLDGSERLIHFTFLGTGYQNGQFIYNNLTGVDDEGGTYTAQGYYDRLYLLNIVNLIQTA